MTPTYAPALTETAVELGQADLCADMGRLVEFIAACADDRRTTAYFGWPISVRELFSDFLLNPKAGAEQKNAAAAELRARYVESEREFVLAAASRAMEA